jgi:hypothetical protein
MAQVSLGEVLSSPDARAYSAINSKRVDLLIVSRSGDPIAAIEYHGHGHYQGTAAARDAVKKEALRKAGVRYIEVTPESGTADMTREILRIAQEERLKGSECRESRAADSGSLCPAPPTRPWDIQGWRTYVESHTETVQSLRLFEDGFLPNHQQQQINQNLHQMPDRMTPEYWRAR